MGTMPGFMPVEMVDESEGERATLSEQIRAARNYRAQRSIQQRDFMTAARSFSPTHFHLVAVDTIEKCPAFGLNVGLGARCHSRGRAAPPASWLKSTFPRSVDNG
jgi:hypothetical protein